MKMEVKVSDTRATVHKACRLLIWKNTAVTLTRGRGFWCDFCIWYPRDFSSPSAHVSVQACAWNRGASLCRSRDWWQLAEREHGQSWRKPPAAALPRPSGWNRSFGRLLPSRATPVHEEVLGSFSLRSALVLTGWAPRAARACVPQSAVRQLECVACFCDSQFSALRGNTFKTLKCFLFIAVDIQKILVWSGQQGTWKMLVLHFVKKMGRCPSPYPANSVGSRPFPPAPCV